MQLFKPIKVGVIGCGNISGAYMSRMKRYEVLELNACADLEVFRAEAKAEQYKIPNIYTLDEMLHDKKIQLIVNLTTPKIHAKINQAIVQAGKHLFSEKPLALNRGEAYAILTEAIARKVLVGCAPDTFFGGGIQTCRKVLDEGLIGDPIAVTSFMGCRGHEHWHPAPEFYYQPGGGPMFDMGPYYLSAMVYLLGSISRVSGSCRASSEERIITSEKKRGTKIPVQVPTHYSGTLDFASGTIGTIVQSFDIGGHNLPHMEIYGTKGTLSVPDPNSFGGPVLVKLHDDEEWREINLTHNKDVGRGVGVADMAYSIMHNRPHRANGQFAYHILDVILALEESSKAGRHFIVESPCDRPAALPTWLEPYELDF